LRRRSLRILGFFQNYVSIYRSSHQGYVHPLLNIVLTERFADKVRFPREPQEVKEMIDEPNLTAKEFGAPVDLNYVWLNRFLFQSMALISIECAREFLLCRR